MSKIYFIPSVPESKKDEEKIKIKMEVTVMSKADEMFENLGYVKKEYSYKFSYENDKKQINFYKDKKISCTGLYDDFEYITMQELQAINEKVKELGWNEQSI